VVKIPSFARREERAEVDENRTATDPDVVRDRPAERPTLWGRWADRDRTRVTDPATGAPVPADATAPASRTASAEPTAPASATAPVRSTSPVRDTAPAEPTSPAGPNSPTAAERRLAGTDLSDSRRTDDRLTDGRPSDGRLTDAGPTDVRPTEPETEPTPVVPAGPRPRTSGLATLSLVFGISGMFLVLSGALAGYGIAVGAIGVLLAMFAFGATRKRHVAGKFDAMLGLLIGGAAVVIGILAFTGAFGWPTTDGDWVERLRGWLDSQFVDRF
jgi:hypothetical protein